MNGAGTQGNLQMGRCKPVQRVSIDSFSFPGENKPARVLAAKSEAAHVVEAQAAADMPILRLFFEGS